MKNKLTEWKNTFVTHTSKGELKTNIHKVLKKRVSKTNDLFEK